EEKLVSVTTATGDLLEHDLDGRVPGRLANSMASSLDNELNGCAADELDRLLPRPQKDRSYRRDQLPVCLALDQTLVADVVRNFNLGVDEIGSPQALRLSNR